MTTAQPHEKMTITKACPNPGACAMMLVGLSPAMKHLPPGGFHALENLGLRETRKSSIMDQSPTVKIVVHPSIAEISPDDWDACANPIADRFNPFVSHAFLHILEEAGCVGRAAGWIPQHLVLTGSEGTVDGVMPCYVKTNSRGEYVFDYAFADAYQRAGGAYYPKLQCAVPFTPVPGPRVMARPGPDAEDNERILTRAAMQLAQRLELSSLHITFLEADAWKRLGDAGLLQRTDQQFHFANDGYETFDDFLACLASRKRKAIRKERATALESGITIEHLSGGDISEAHWDAFYAFYTDTGDRKWGNPYLNRRFFSLLGERLGDHCLLVMAKRNDRYIAGALNLIGGDCLYGRYWGTIEHHPFLHFEVCYYQAIEYAITHSLKRVEAGAQGDHKLARGYLPTTTYSLHWFADPGLSAAVERYLISERREVAKIGTALSKYAPFKKTACEDEPH
ncbi:conserved protein of unknown function [Candidatus Filomicrobium marinum]|uniref:N-acetyltransferase n=2 Tax=Hyphomicrobiaceae TaxID=45401 RepID=A0A0D6JA63_9HYPH|nr:conserved protein of unknown function [Candidatus Filomicrobium marinum]CPR15393.1 conserved protein of unknown function [Candidatus Filomicrobium marinum]